MLVKGLSMLLFGAATVLACEMDCRKGLAGDFAEVYTPVIENSVNGLESSLESSIKAIKVPTILTNEVSEEEMYTNIENAVKKSLKQFVTYATDSKLADGIYRVMFAEELPYKGDCNNPARLTRKMPPQGESWTLEECSKMDYRCGNPPSICYFLDDVKQRIVGRIRRQLTDYTVSDNGELVVNLIRNTKSAIYTSLAENSASAISEKSEVQGYVDKIVSSAVRTLDIWINNDVHKLCDTPDQDYICNGWDDKIKLSILKWP